MKTLLMTASLMAVLSACGGGGEYTQAEVDAFISDAVDDAVEQARADFETEAAAEAEAAVAEAEAAEAATQAIWEAVTESCDLDAGRSPYITADEAGLTIEGQGDESPGLPYDAVWCVLDGLDVPESILSRIENTNSTMGLVDGSWGDYDAEWSYHPDNGLAIHIAVAEGS